MPIVTLKNTPILIDLAQYATDNGWTISNGVAYHDSCFAGYIKLKNIPVQPGDYVVQYSVQSWITGSVYPVVGGVSGIPRSLNGSYTETITVPENPTNTLFQFYSDGTLGIRYVALYPVSDVDNAVTLGFNAANNRWTTYYSYHPEFMLKFVNDLFSWKNGRLWKHNSNETRNNFYGQQYYSEIEIIFNIEATEVKNLFAMRVNSNLAWSVTDVYIRPIVGKQAGQRSRIKSGNFRNLNGQWSAEFLRNMLDPKFVSELEALVKGSPLQGTTAKLTLKSTDTSEVRLVSIDILGSRQDFNY